MDDRFETNQQVDLGFEAQSPETSALSRHEYESLVNSLPGVVWEFDLTAKRFTFVSQQAQQLFGYPITQWLSQPRFWLEHLHPDDQTWVTQVSVRETQAKRNYELELLRGTA